MKRDEDSTPASAMEAMAMMATKDATSTTVVPATESANTEIGFSTACAGVPVMKEPGSITAVMMYATTA